MMKLIFIFLTIISFLNAENYIFLVKKYHEEIELEAKIISNIATAAIDKDIKLYIPNISQVDKKIYSKYFKLSNNCEESNFIFMKDNFDESNLCIGDKKLFFTNNYRSLIMDNRFFGAFFWNKSRPNIVFVKNRLIKNRISLPKSYNQFIEEFDEK